MQQYAKYLFNVGIGRCECLLSMVMKIGYIE